MEYYALVKHIHMGAASLSLLGFIIRGYWMLKESPLLQAKLTKILPHIIDTILLAGAVYLVVVAEFNVFEIQWLLAKIILLVAYILIGLIIIMSTTLTSEEHKRLHFLQAEWEKDPQSFRSYRHK